VAHAVYGTNGAGEQSRTLPFAKEIQPCYINALCLLFYFAQYAQQYRRSTHYV